MSDKCYFEMNETEANLKNMMNTLEFLDYQIATGNIFTVMGHSSLAMTMDLYSHVLPDTKAEEMQKIANVF